MHNWRKIIWINQSTNNFKPALSNSPLSALSNLLLRLNQFWHHRFSTIITVFGQELQLANTKDFCLFCSLFYVLIFSLNLFFGKSNIWLIDYALGISVFLGFPIVVGKLSLFWLYDKVLTIKDDPSWVKLPIFWASGNIVLNLVAIASHITHFDYKIWTLILLIWLMYFFGKFSQDYWHPQVFKRQSLSQLLDNLEFSPIVDINSLSAEDRLILTKDLRQLENLNDNQVSFLAQITHQVQDINSIRLKFGQWILTRFGNIFGYSQFQKTTNCHSQLTTDCHPELVSESNHNNSQTNQLKDYLRSRIVQYFGDRGLNNIYHKLVYLCHKTIRITQLLITRITHKISLLETYSLIFFVFTNLSFFGWWYWRMDWVSFNTDSLQNAHLSNILKIEKVFNPLAIYISPQYTQVDYTTTFSPNYALATEFFDFRQIMRIMVGVELSISTLILIVRYKFFCYLNIPKFASASLAFLASMITFSGLYMSGTFYNQQVLVFCLPIVLYFLYQKRFVSAILLFVMLFAFHFTMSVFLAYTVGSFLFFWFIERSRFFRFIAPFFHTGKYIFIGVLLIILSIAAIWTFETNYLIVDKLLAIFATKPQYANTIGIYSNVAIIQILLHGLGPLLGAFMLAMPFAWLYTENKVHRWAYFIVSVQIAILSVPFPVAGRTFVFFSLPFVLGVYFVLTRILTRAYLVNISLVILMLSNVLWSVSVRTQDLDITGNYWNAPFLERDYMDFLIMGSDILKDKGIVAQDYKVISEYFVKHHFESMAYKLDDSGVYQEDKAERLLLFEFLNNSRQDACQHYKIKYLVYLLNERVYKWSKVPKTLAKNSAFAVWWSKPTTIIESNYIFSFEPKTSGKVELDKTLGQNRFILVKC